MGNPAPSLYFYSSNMNVIYIRSWMCTWLGRVNNQFYLSAPPHGRLLELPEWSWMLVDTEYSNKLGQTSTFHIVLTKVV